MELTEAQLWKWFEQTQAGEIPRLADAIFFPVTNDVTGDAIAAFYLDESGEPKIAGLLRKEDLESEIDRLTKLLKVID